jgi:uncharacterized repeat protein (TIGR03803 family)
MKKRTVSLIVRSIAAILPLTFYSAAVVAQTHLLIALTDFGQTPNDGNGPSSPLVFDKAGNLYGVTSDGGESGWGTVFELTKKPDGVWARKTLYVFKGGSDGGYPGGSSNGALVLDAAGNLYGTTQGAYRDFGTANGTVFELSPNGDGSWTETVLHNFARTVPTSGVIFDSAGNLYGTTGRFARQQQTGTIFELTPQEGGGWKESILYSFQKADGDQVSGLTMDDAGNLYGTTGSFGSTSSGGFVFKLSPGSDGTWSYTILHTFPLPRNNASGDGINPLSGVILDAAGNIYGTTGGGKYGYGSVFEIPAGQDPNGPDKILYSFDGLADGGQYPIGGLVFDPSGNLYGTTAEGGVYGYGKIFELLPNGDGTWTKKTLHNFGGQKYNGFTGIDGILPGASMVLDADGNLYGVAGGGYHPGDPSTGGGVAFELKLH